MLFCLIAPQTLKSQIDIFTQTLHLFVPSSSGSLSSFGVSVRDWFRNCLSLLNGQRQHLQTYCSVSSLFCPGSRTHSSITFCVMHQHILCLSYKIILGNQYDSFERRQAWISWNEWSYSTYSSMPNWNQISLKKSIRNNI